MSDTLLLNLDFTPISILPLSVINYQHAIKLMFLGRVTVLETYPNWLIRSEKLTINVPSVCVTKDYFKFTKYVKFTRQNMYLRDLFKCQYCEEIFDYHDLTLDHVIPRSMGGKATWENSVTACKSCNSKKGAKLWKPKVAPYAPDYYSLVSKWKQTSFTVRQDSWNKYLGVNKRVA